MAERVLSKNDIEDYVLPQLKILKALFLALRLKGTLISLDLLENVLDVELEQSYKKLPANRGKSGATFCPPCKS